MGRSGAESSRLPLRWVIADYWGDTEVACGRHPRAWEFVIDLGEPACFACGWYVESWQTYPDVSAERAWNGARGLERAHLIPRARGGPGLVDNLVLLCKSCHVAAPDYRDPRYMLEWMVRRPSWLTLMFDELFPELTPLGLTLERLESFFTSPDCKDLLRRQYANSVDHFGMFSSATRAVVIMEALAEYESRESQADGSVS